MVILVGNSHSSAKALFCARSIVVEPQEKRVVGERVHRYRLSFGEIVKFNIFARHWIIPVQDNLLPTIVCEFDSMPTDSGRRFHERNTEPKSCSQHRQGQARSKGWRHHAVGRVKARKTVLGFTLIVKLRNAVAIIMRIRIDLIYEWTVEVRIADMDALLKIRVCACSSE